MKPHLNGLRDTRWYKSKNTQTWKPKLELTAIDTSREVGETLGGTSSTRYLILKYLYNDFTFETIMQKLVGEKIVHEKRILDRIRLKNGTNRPLFFTIGRWRYEKSCFYVKITWVCSKIEVPKWRESGAKNAVNSLKTMEKTRFGS